MKIIFTLLIYFAASIFSSFSSTPCSGTLTMTATPTSVCRGEPLNVKANLSTGNAGWKFAMYKTSIIPANKINDTNYVNTIISLTTKFFVTTDSAGCSQKKDSITVTANVPPVLQISPSKAICLGQCVQLTATSGTGTTYIWSPCGVLNS